MAFNLLSWFSKTAKYVTVIHPNFDFSSDVNRSFNIDNDLIASVFTCEKILAETLSKLPLEIYQSNEDLGKIKQKNHSLYRILHNYPNQYSTSTSFFSTLEKHRNHYGNAFAKIIRNRVGKVQSLEIVHPKYITGYKLHKGNLYFYFDDGENQEVINNENILHFKFLSEDGLFGLNPLQVLYSELDNIFQGKTVLNKAYRNNMNTERVIETPSLNMNTANAKASLDELRKEHSGAANTGKTPVLPAGFKMISLPKVSMQDAQILESINYSKKDIAALYGVPNSMLGMDGQSYNSIEQMTLNFKTNTLQYIARIYRQELERKLLSDAELNQGITIEFNLSALVETDMKTRIEYLSKLFQMGVLPQNEIARIEGFPTIEGGDYTWMQSQYVPIQKYETYAKVNQGQPVQDKKEEPMNE